MKYLDNSLPCINCDLSLWADAGYLFYCEFCELEQVEDITRDDVCKCSDSEDL